MNQDNCVRCGVKKPVHLNSYKDGSVLDVQRLLGKCQGFKAPASEYVGPEILGRSFQDILELAKAKGMRSFYIGGEFLAEALAVMCAGGDVWQVFPEGDRLEIFLKEVTK